MKLLISIFIITQLIFSQRPNYVIETFKSTHLIHVNTTEQLYKNTMEFTIAHRFGDAYSGLKDLFGVDLGANIYFAMDFGITDDFQAGFARYSFGKIYEANLKYRITRQSRDNSMPISISVFSAALYQSDSDLAEERNLFVQGLIARKFSKNISIQIAPFFNQRLEYERKNAIIGAQSAFGINLAGRYRVTKRSSILIEWAKLLNKKDYNQNSPADLKVGNIPSFSVSYNIQSGGHTYQVVLSNQQRINSVFAQYGTNTDLFERHFYFGFNLTRLFEL